MTSTAAMLANLAGAGPATEMPRRIDRVADSRVWKRASGGAVSLPANFGAVMADPPGSAGVAHPEPVAVGSRGSSTSRRSAAQSSASHSMSASADEGSGATGDLLRIPEPCERCGKELTVLRIRIKGKACCVECYWASQNRRTRMTEAPTKGRAE